MALTQPIGLSEASPSPPAGEEGRVTPAMAQYLEIKAANPGFLLFYRMGDFYELFFEDAEIASAALGIVLTKRGKHQGHDIPHVRRAGARADDYLNKLIALGHRVAICEQIEDPAEAKKRGANCVVKRDVVRLVTPGTITEDTCSTRGATITCSPSLAQHSSADGDARFALAWVDISTGEFRVAECEPRPAAGELARIEPGEILVPDALYDDPGSRLIARSLPAVTPLARDVFDSATAERRLHRLFRGRDHAKPSAR